MVMQHMSYSELRKLSQEELIERYDARAGETILGLGFYREEIARQ